MAECAVCRDPAAELLSSPDDAWWAIRCPTCREYRISKSTALGAALGLSGRERGVLCGLLSRRTGHQTRALDLPQDRASLAALLATVAAPARVDDALTLLLISVAAETPAFGMPSESRTSRAWAALMYMHPESAAGALIKEVQRRGWLDVRHTLEDQPMQDGKYRLALTLAGWEELHRRDTRAMSSTTAFVATWDNPQIREEGIPAMRRALAACGLTAVVGIDLGSAQRVTDDIEAGIRHARLVVADFTGNRAGVYWEAGLARGLGLPVVYTCHDSLSGDVIDAIRADSTELIAQKPWREQLHFDTTQFPHLFWTSPDDLERRLAARIQANGWDERGRSLLPSAE